MPNMVVGHDLHALIYGLFRIDRDDFRSHDFAHLGIVAALALKYNFASIVTL